MCIRLRKTSYKQEEGANDATIQHHLQQALERLHRADMEELNVSLAAPASLAANENLELNPNQQGQQRAAGVSTRRARRDEQEYHPPQVDIANSIQELQLRLPFILRSHICRCWQSRYNAAMPYMAYLP